MNKYLEIIPYHKGLRRGLDIVLQDEAVTVEHYTRAIDTFILKGHFERERNRTCNSCEGCNLCCQERIPLTSIDVLTLLNNQFPNLSLQRFLQQYAYIFVEGRVVDITLAQDMYGKCVFLRSDNRCAIYTNRPLVCRTYICTLLSERAASLREEIVNIGEDELVRLWFLLGAERPVHETIDACLDSNDWPENNWTNKKSFADIKIKDIVTPELWRKLVR